VSAGIRKIDIYILPYPYDSTVVLQFMVFLRFYRILMILPYFDAYRFIFQGS
jgi:hypothetical protein